MGEHQPESDLTRQGVRLPQVERTLGQTVHRPRSREIEGEPRPEGGHVPPLQVAGDPLRPDPQRVEGQRQ